MNWASEIIRNVTMNKERPNMISDQ